MTLSGVHDIVNVAMKRDFTPLEKLRLFFEIHWIKIALVVALVLSIA